MKDFMNGLVRMFFSPVQITLYIGAAVCMLVASRNAYVVAGAFLGIAVICFLKNTGKESFLLGIYAKACVAFSILMGIAAVFALPRTPDQGDALGYGATVGYAVLAIFPWTIVFRPVGLAVTMVSAFGLTAMGFGWAKPEGTTSVLLLGLFAVATLLHAPAKVAKEES